MDGENAYFTLLNLLESLSPLDAQLFFMQLQGHYKIDHLIYADLAQGPEGLQIYRLLHDEDPAIKHLLPSHGKKLLRLIVDLTFETVTPSDIGPDVTPASSESQRFFQSLGLGSHAVIFPLVPRPGRKAFLSIYFQRQPAFWAQTRRNLVRDIHSLAAYFHARQLAVDDPTKGQRQPARLRLTPREEEVLSWAAAGKSYWEIGIILGISERTVRYFMGNVRMKLDVVSNKQAVAEAIWHGLIAGGQFARRSSNPADGGG
jgi:LuxR family transcriptional regulator, quorum-sensing system regulator SinR